MRRNYADFDDNIQSSKKLSFQRNKQLFGGRHKISIVQLALSLLLMCLLLSGCRDTSPTVRNQVSDSSNKEEILNELIDDEPYTAVVSQKIVGSWAVYHYGSEHEELDLYESLNAGHAIYYTVPESSYFELWEIYKDGTLHLGILLVEKPSDSFLPPIPGDDAVPTIEGDGTWHPLGAADMVDLSLNLSLSSGGVELSVPLKDGRFYDSVAAYDDGDDAFYYENDLVMSLDSTYWLEEGAAPTYSFWVRRK